MKKTISTLLLTFAVLDAALAAPVSNVAAEKTAKAFFGVQNVTMVWSDQMATKSSTAVAPSYYAFNNPAGGWVIIAGDDCCEPVLAYCAEGSFNGNRLPPNFEAWMGRISGNISSVRAAGLSPKSEIKAKWASVGATKAVTSEEYIQTASWGQEAPFNDKCPKYNSRRCLTGCVATAMSIVLRNNCRPVKGTGTIPAYTTYSNNISVPAVTLGADYDWANMPLEYGSNYTSAQAEAVSTLMYHCGTMVQMDYDPDGSGAMSCDIVPALVEYMGYSNSAREMYRNNYSNSDWFRIIKSEIDAGRVILYGGSDSSTEDGHQFVLDGYNSNNMVHINWGWNGQCNAWYAINYLGDKSSSGVADVFSYYDSAIIGLLPEEGPETANVELCLEAYESLYGISLAEGSIAKASTFAVNLGYICNYDYYTDYSGAVKVGLYDRNGNLKEYVSAETGIKVSMAKSTSTSVTPGTATVKNLSCTVTSDIALGDYLMAVYKLTDGSWATLGGYNSDEFTDASNEYHTIYKLGALDLAYLNLPSSVSEGQVVYFDLVGSHKLPSSIVWYWDGSKNTARYVKATSGSHTLKAVVTYTDSSVESVQKMINVYTGLP